MSNQREKTLVEEALLEVELAMRYNAHQRAIAALEATLAQLPSNTDLRWKLAELHYQQGSPHNSAEQLFIISDIYVSINQLDFAESTLLKVKQVYPPASFHVDTKLATLKQLQTLSKYQEQLSSQEKDQAKHSQTQATEQYQRQQSLYTTNYPNQYQQPYPNQYGQPYPNQYQQPYPNQYQQPYPNQFQQPYINPYQQAYPNQYGQTEEYDYSPPLIELEPIDISESEIAEVQAAVAQQKPSDASLAGDLHYINLFDVIQTLEKNEITGILHIKSESINGDLYLNRGLLADAICGDLRGKAAFKCFAEVTEGNFELEKSPVEFYQSIQAESNAKLILEIFSEGETEFTEEEPLPNEQGDIEELNW